MRRAFVLTPEARNDLKDILLDIAEDSPDTAERLRSEFYEMRQSLGRPPGMGHYHDELLSRKYRFCVVAYAWEAKPIQIISVVHGARDLAVFFTLRVSR